MFEFYRVHIPSRSAGIEQLRALAPELQDFETWAARNEEKLRAVVAG